MIFKDILSKWMGEERAASSGWNKSEQEWANRGRLQKNPREWWLQPTRPVKAKGIKANILVTIFTIMLRKLLPPVFSYSQWD